MDTKRAHLFFLLHRPRLHVRMCSVLLVVFAACPAVAQTDSLQQHRDDERRESITQHQVRLRPARISDATIESWKTTFELDQAQQEFLDALHEEYARRCERLETHYRRPIFELWDAAFRYDRDARKVVPVPNPQLIELNEKHVALIRGLFSADQRLFESLASQLLTPVQAQLAREHAARLLGFVDIPVAQRTARLDVSELIEQIEFNESERSLIDPILHEHYADIVNTLLDTIPQILETTERERYLLLVELGPEWAAVANEDDRNEIMRTLQALAGQTASIPLWLADRNRRTIRLIEDQIEYTKSDSLFDLYSRTIDPDLFEEVDTVRDFVRAWQAELPVDEARDAAMEESHRRIERRIRMRTDEYFTAREQRAANHPATMPISPVEETSAAIHRILAEIEELEFRIARRELLMQMASSILSVVQSSLPEQTRTARSFHDMQESRQDADRWRLARLQQRLEEVLLIEGEHSHDDD